MNGWRQPDDELARAAGAAPADAFDGAGDFKPGDVIDGTEYRVLKPLGEGGHAAAYECENGIGKRVAVKVLHRHLAARTDLVQRMVEEARRTASLRHRNIVEVHNAGMTAGARPRAFIVMELLTGSNGRQLLLLKHRLEVPHALDVLIDICHALDAAHRAGVVHQDLKPDNIFIHLDEWNRTAVTKLLDFGVARMLGQAHEGTFEGTLAYAAPEQLRGQPITSKTDLYALGVIAYELLTGRRPFEEAEALDQEEREAPPGSVVADRHDAGHRHLVEAVLNTVPPPLCDFVRLPRALEEYVLQLLQKDPARRPENAKVIANTLVAMRQSPSLPKSTVTTQQLLLNAAHSPKVPVPKGETLRMATLDVAAISRQMGANPPHAVDEAATELDAPLFVMDRAGRAEISRAADAPLPPVPVAAVARTPAPRVQSDPRAQQPDAVRTNRLPSVPPIQEKTADLRSVDLGPPAQRSVVGTFEPVTERSAQVRPRASKAATEGSSQLARRIVVVCIAVAACCAIAGTFIGVLRWLQGTAPSTPSLAAPSVVESVPQSAPLPASTPVTSQEVAAPAVALPSSDGPTAVANLDGSAAPSVVATVSPAPVASAEPPKPKPKRAPAKAASSADPLMDWLERPSGKKPATPGPGF